MPRWASRVRLGPENGLSGPLSGRRPPVVLAPALPPPDCQLTWHGITFYGAIDAGFGWQSHGAPFDPRSTPGASYLVQKYSRSSRWDLAPNGLQNSFIGSRELSRSLETSLVFALDAGFDPYS